MGDPEREEVTVLNGWAPSGESKIQQVWQFHEWELLRALNLEDYSGKHFRSGIPHLYSLFYSLASFKSKIYPQIFFIFSLLQMPIVACKSVKFWN